MKDTRDGMAIMIAIIVPFNKISFKVRLLILLLVNIDQFQKMVINIRLQMPTNFSNEHGLLLIISRK